MKKLAKYLKNYRRQAFFAPVFKLMEALMDLIVPLVVASIINSGISGGQTSSITRGFMVLIILAVAGMLFSFTAQWFAARASVGFSTDLRQALFDHIESLSFSGLDTLGTDTLITRMTSDINQVQNGLNLALRLLLRSPFIVFGSMIMAFTIDVRCALIFAVAIPVLCAAVFGIMYASIPLYAKSQEGLDRLLSTTRENLTGVRVIRAFCREEDEIREFDRRNEALTKMNDFVGRLSALMNPVTYVLINLATVILIRTGAVRVNLGHIRQGDVVALYNYMAQIIVELIKLASLIITINKSIACADRIEAIFEVTSGMEYPDAFPDAGIARTASEKYPAAPQAGPAAASRTESTADSDAASGLTSPAVRFENVSFSYTSSGDEAISGIDFSAAKGKTVGIIGGTGSGKSTVVSLIPRFYDTTAGSVYVNGINVRDYPEGSLIRRIGVVPQKAVLFEGTIRDNLLWGNPDASESDLWRAIDTAQAREVVEGKEHGLDAPIEQNGRNLSGGQRQRLTIARALVRNPDILIMDDSASALDFATDYRLRRAVHALGGNMTVFIVSQRTSSVRSADMILVLDDGRLVGKGTHDELMKSCKTYQEIYCSQFPEERPPQKEDRSPQKAAYHPDGGAGKSGSTGHMDGKGVLA